MTTAYAQPRLDNRASRLRPCGGAVRRQSAEREVSLKSGNAVLEALQSAGVNAFRHRRRR